MAESKGTDHPAFESHHQDKILDLIAQIEKEHDVTVVCAVDNGSRSMGIHTEKSDFDIRFIYRYNRLAKHLVGSYPDSMNLFFDDGMYDFDGWTVDKAIKLLKESNPSLIEWIHSPVVFLNKSNFLGECQKIIKVMHNKLSIFYHYSSMATKNYNTWIKDNEMVIYKKYIYVVRPLLMLLNLEHGEELVILDMKQLHSTVRDKLPDDVNDSIEEAIRLKQTTKGLEGPKLPVLDKWIEDYLDEIDHMKEKKSKKKGDNMKARGVISGYDKMINEVNKVNTIARVRKESVNRVNYLSAIFSVLEFLWMYYHRDKSRKEMPSSIAKLMSDITEVTDEVDLTGVHSDIKSIVDMKETTELDPTIVTERNNIVSKLLVPIGDFLSEVDSSIESKLFSSTERDDIYEHSVLQALSLWALVKNPEKRLQDMPKNILSDKSILEPKVHEGIVKYLQLLKPIYYVDPIESLHVWFDNVIEKYEDLVREYQVNLQKIKEINVKERYAQSMKAVDEMVFIDLFDLAMN